jgi:hypothetical protein
MDRRMSNFYNTEKQTSVSTSDKKQNEIRSTNFNATSKISLIEYVQYFRRSNEGQS